MRAQRVVLVLALLVAGPAAASAACPASATVTTCAGLKAQLDCIATSGTGPGAKFTIKLACTGAPFNCTGLALQVAASVKLRKGPGCGASRSPVLAVSQSDALAGSPLVTVAAGAALDAADISLVLAGVRSGVRAVKAAGVRLTGCLVSNGTSPQRGGALQLEDTPATLTSCRLTANSAAASGGAIAASATPGGGAPEPMLVVRGSRLDGNQATTGGALWLSEAVTSLSDVTITGNAADQNGGGIAAFTTRRDTAVALTVAGTTSTLTGNTAGGRGGAIFLGDARAKLKSATLSRNRAGGGGGAVAANVTGSDITNADAPVVTLYLCSVEENEAVGSGGAVHLSGARAFITTSGLRRNRAGSDGGAVHTEALRLDRDLLLRLWDVDVSRNTASGGGGGVNAIGVPVSIAGTSSVASNVAASGSGGGVRVSTRFLLEPALELIDSGLKDNTAYLDGGGAWVLSEIPASNPTPSVSLRATARVTDNTAVRGAGLWLQDVRVSIASTTFLTNKAASGPGGEGGAVWFRASPTFAFSSTVLVATSATFNANRAASGGAIFVVKDSTLPLGISCASCVFKDNESPGPDTAQTGASIATLKNDTATGGQLSVDLGTATFIGTVNQATICGRTTDTPFVASTVVFATDQLAPCASAALKAVCRDYCFDDLQDVSSPRPGP